MIASSAPSLPIAILLPVLMLLGALQAWAMWRIKDNAARFIMAALWLRFVMSAFHQITYAPIAAGLSLNALASCAVFALGLWVAKPAGWNRAALLPVYGVMLAVLLSAAVNAELIGAFGTLVKWGYFAVILLCAWQAMERLGSPRLAGAALWSFAPPLVLQWMSVWLGVSKRADEDGGSAFIGGYDHEAAFSIVLLGALFLTTLQRGLPPLLRPALAAICVVGLYLAAYRTSLIAAAPLVAAYLITSIAQVFAPGERRAVSALASIVAVAAIGGAAALLGERLQDFVIAFQEADLLRPPKEYRLLEQELFSSRLYLWSQYLDAWIGGGLREHAFGFGPDAWEGAFITYAHNTLISTVYELGLVGAAALLSLWGYMAAQAVRAAARLDGLLLVAGHVSVFLLNMATMAHWLVEGLIFYALLCAFTLHTAARFAIHRRWEARAWAVAAKS